MRKFCNLFFSILTVFSLLVSGLGLNSSNSSFAEETKGSITINGAEANKTYELYKIFSLRKTGENTVEYSLSSDEWKTFFKTNAGSEYMIPEDEYSPEDFGYSLNPITIDGEKYYINIFNNSANEADDRNEHDFANSALKYIAARGINFNKSVNGTAESTLTVGDLDLGYYLVYPKGAAHIKDGHATICSLTSTNPNATVQVKSKYPTIEKTVDDEDKIVEIGQTVEYKITGKVPELTGYIDNYKYIVKDTLSTGLTLDLNSVVVKIDGNPIQGYTKTFEDNVLKVEINMTQHRDDVDKKVEITYNATVNKNAVIGKVGILNNAKLIYSNDPKNPNNTPNEDELPSSTTIIYTGGIKIDKSEYKNNLKKLSGAKFKLYKVEGSTNKYAKINDENGSVTWVDDKNDATEVTTTANGEANFKGLLAGEYKLEETEAPNGYNKLSAPIDVTVSPKEDAESKIVSVENSSGFLLPETGGIGNTFVRVAGLGVFVIAAGIYLNKRLKKSSN